jgi:sugar-specific transcriptional regulator TrmB
MYEELFKAIGLNENEAEIYEILLNLGPVPVREILKKTALQRSNLYNVLSGLKSRGLIGEKLGGAGLTIFYPETPDKLEDLVAVSEKKLAQSKSQLGANLDALKGLFLLSQERPTIRFFEGKEGIQKVLYESLKAKGEIYTYIDAEGVEKYIKQINEKYVEKRSELKIPKKIIALGTPFAREHYKQTVSSLTEVRFIPPEFKPFQTGMQIYDNTIAYTTLTDKKMIGVIIEDENIAQMHRSIFEYLWSTLK